MYYVQVENIPFIFKRTVDFDLDDSSVNSHQRPPITKEESQEFGMAILSNNLKTGTGGDVK